MLATEAFQWSKVFIAGLCAIGAVLAWLVNAEFANERSDQD
jgi:hypothetical protein